MYPQLFRDYLEKENIISRLIKYYNPNLTQEKFEERNKFVCNLIEDLKSMDLDMFNDDYDVISRTYENNKEHKVRKKLGEFFTPISVVNYILDKIGYNSESHLEEAKIIDISCGVGSFLIQAIRRLLTRYLIIFKRNTIHDLTEDEAKLIIEVINRNIYGIDINPTSCVLCQINIQYIIFDLIQHIQIIDEEYQVHHFNIENYNAMRVDILKQYDFVIGNPPYLFIRDIP